MRNFKITEDRTTRVVRFEELTGTTPLTHQPYDWAEPKERAFHPEHGALTLVDGVRTSITIAGPQILKGGKLSESIRLKARWSAKNITNAPSWVQDVWAQAGQVYR
jgi:hypothetical protein